MRETVSRGGCHRLRDVPRNRMRRSANMGLHGLAAMLVVLTLPSLLRGLSVPLCNSSVHRDSRRARTLLTSNAAGCLQKGLPMPEFEEYARLQPQLVAQSSANTLQLAGPLVAVNDATAGGGHGRNSSQLVSVAADELQAALAAMEAQHVVYIPNLLAVQQTGRVGAFAGSCAPQCDYDLMRPGLHAALLAFESVQGCHPFDSLFTGEHHAA